MLESTYGLSPPFLHHKVEKKKKEEEEEEKATIKDNPTIIGCNFYFFCEYFWDEYQLCVFPQVGYQINFQGDIRLMLYYIN